MRVIAGSARGQRLKTLPGAAVRPTGDRVKESLFNILAFRLPGCHFLDLCAGSGSIGIEALSRGAARVVFVDRAAPSLQMVRANLAVTGLGARAEVIRGDALAVLGNLAHRGERFDLIFIDPPYNTDLGQAVPGLPALAAVLAPGGWAILEHHRRLNLHHEEIFAAGALARFREITLGETMLSFFHHSSPVQGGETLA